MLEGELFRPRCQVDDAPPPLVLRVRFYRVGAFSANVVSEYHFRECVAVGSAVRRRESQELCSFMVKEAVVDVLDRGIDIPQSVVWR